MAHLSKDEALIEAFNSGADFHAATASSVFAIPLAEVTADQRRKIKAMNYGLAYGLSRLRALPAARHPHRRGAGADGRILRAVRRRARLPAGGRRAGPAGRLHRDDPRPPALPARPDQRQPPAARDGRADGAQRADPGLGGRHHQGGDAAGRRRPARGRPAVADAAAGPRRAGLRGGAGRARAAGGDRCGARWAAPTRCPSRSRSRSAPAATGTAPTTEGADASRPGGSGGAGPHGPLTGSPPPRT